MRLQLGAVGLVLAAVACGAEPRETPEAAEPGAFEPEFRITATIEEVMRYMIDPSGDAIWEAVVTEVTPEGVNEMVPETDEDWIELRRHAMILIEATNLILMHDRPLAAPGSRSELPGVDLEPEEIQALLNANRPAWDQFALALGESGRVVLDAVDRRDVDALLLAGDGLDLACENCHVRFWYPSLADDDTTR